MRETDRSALDRGDVFGYEFRERRWLVQALTHRSYVFEHGGRVEEDNERLEFLGDAVVQLAVSWLLFCRFPDSREGELTRLRAQLVRQDTLASVAREAGLGERLRLGRAARGEGLQGQERLLASAFEAVMGAIFVDGGWEAARRAVQQALEPYLDRLAAPGEANPKGALQELLARRGYPAPQYRLVRVEGEPHRRRFSAEVLVNGAVLGHGTGTSRKRAEQEAARMALRRLGDGGGAAGPEGAEAGTHGG